MANEEGTNPSLKFQLPPASCSGRNTQHGMAKILGGRVPEYRAWEGMKRRCKETKTKDSRNYRERGITICEEWMESFVAFYEDVGPRPGPGYTLDRKDNDAGYVPGNVRWATYEEQNRNRRSVPLFEFGGQTKTLPEWAAAVGIRSGTLRMRMTAGMSFAEAIVKPLDTRKSHSRGKE